MPPAPKTTPKNYPRPTIVSRNRVARRGDRLSKPLLWQGRQWAVTGYGVEARDGTYPIRKARLGEGTWDDHMADKGWVDMPDFRAALAWARAHFNIATPPRGPALEAPPAAALGETDKPTPGLNHIVDGHLYGQVGEYEFEAKGRKHLVLRLLSECEACGAPFGVEAPAEAFDRGLPKRCDRCAVAPSPAAWVSTGRLSELLG